MFYRIAGAISKHGRVAKGEIGTHEELEWLKISDFTDVEFSRLAVDM